MNFDYKLDKLFKSQIGKYSFTITTDYYKPNEELNIKRFNKKYYQSDKGEFFNRCRIRIDNNKLDQKNIYLHNFKYIKYI